MSDARCAAPADTTRTEPRPTATAPSPAIDPSASQADLNPPSAAGLVATKPLMDLVRGLARQAVAEHFR